MTERRASSVLAFTAENADIKFPFRLPMMDETRQCLLFDIKRHPYCGTRDTRDQAADMHAVMAAFAGYWGGYTSKMQCIGERETRQLREAAQRKVEGEKSEAQPRTSTNMCDGA